MNVFKKLIDKIKGKKHKNVEEECWYNNSHEKDRKKLQWSNPDEDGGAGGSGTQYDMGVVRNMTDRQC